MMGFVMYDRKVEEKWKFCARTRLLLSLFLAFRNLDFCDVLAKTSILTLFLFSQLKF